ncbi:TldD/PmbA family protein [Ilyobacter polytropus]|uniref:Microcin-processing peptidase 2 n=1 Tax=Ilyobacter polytropus (strain ATCC 51220 / DSM 2926 / LMG 16218 / CuHBu1) TaxID=572544 RepID=E3H8C7_ILYPC|nr:TldD/PmbA family protein [Ilyobacter polytropus]ADO82694.1 microcin-processing peptidase 2 [Ilyobacter polytropus DSM 2926]
MLDKILIEDILIQALSTGGDFAEVFIEEKFNTGLFMIDGSIEKSLSGKDFGVGIRIFKGLFSVYAYTNEVTRGSLMETSKRAAEAIKGTNSDITINLIKQDIENRHKILLPPDKVGKDRKVEIMKRAHRAASSYDDSISQVRISYSDSVQNVMIANSEGLWTEDTRTRSRIGIESVASKDNDMQTGSYRPGALKGFEFFEDINVEECGIEASRIAKTMLNAKYCPSGKFPVIIDNEFGGVIFHEACGHGLEATSVAKGNSVFAGKLGQKVASDLVSAVDDGTLENEWGSSNIDDEGTPTKRNLLIENGILKGYMIDKLNGRRMNMESTGSARRESYKFAPTSRMTNTFILAGKSKLNEMISNTENGIYAKRMGGGSVNPATGDFNFSVMEGYLIENGKITEPVRGATLIGNGPEVLNKIDMIGDNLAHGQGMCGSVSGSIPANVGQPAIKVLELTVGGR